MTFTVGDICAFMDAWAPPGWAYEWDRVGLQVGSVTQPVTKVLVCLTVTPKAINAAKRKRASMIIAHHPLIWTPLTALRSDDPQTRLCLDLCQSGIACFAAHTNLDVAPDGVNAALAETLGLRQREILFREKHLRQVKLITFVPETHLDAVRNTLAHAGAGIIGDYTHCSFYSPGTGTFLPGADSNPFVGDKETMNEEPELRLEMILDHARLGKVLRALYAAHPYEEPAYDLIPLENVNDQAGLGQIGMLKKNMPLRSFASFVREALATPHVTVHGAGKRTVRRVAVAGGSGGGLIARLPDDTDVFVTGDVGYHHAEMARLRGIACIDAGHVATEQPVVAEIATRLRHAFPALATTAFSEKEESVVITASD